MPALDDARREKFCIEVASGRTHSDAYRLVYKTQAKANVAANATRLSKENEVILRIRELQDEQRRRIGVSLDHLLRELNATYQLDRRNKQAGAMVWMSCPCCHNNTASRCGPGKVESPRSNVLATPS